MTETANERGLFASLRRLLSTALEIAQVRLDLLGTEVELEKRRLFDGLIWGAMALLAIGVGILMLCALVILLFQDGYRLAALAFMAFLFLGIGALLIKEARQRLRSPGGPFAASLVEIKHDRDGLTPASRHEK